MRTLELFSGAGGLAKGLELAGFEHVALVERNRYACNSLRANFSPEIVFAGDVEDFDFSQLGEVDIVAGGPPCQPFSLGGKHKAEMDSRDMFPYAIRAIEKLKPKAFLFENVKGILRESFADYFDYIRLRLTFPEVAGKPGQDWRDHLTSLRALRKSKFSGLYYDVSYQLLNAADYGVPQSRERVVLVGIRMDQKKIWTFPKPTHSEERLIWEKWVTRDYWHRHQVQPVLEKQLVLERARKLEQEYSLFEPNHLPWQTVRDQLRGVPEPWLQHDIPDHIYREGARVYPGHTGSAIDLPAKTIKAGAHGVPGGENMIRFPDETVRYLTVYEGKRIQTFPEDFVITGCWGEALRQIGNAVPVLLAEVLGQHLRTTLQEGVTERGVLDNLKFLSSQGFLAYEISGRDSLESIIH